MERRERAARVPALLAPRSPPTTGLPRFGREMAGMHLPWGKIAIGGLVAIAAFGGALWASQWLWPGTKERRPPLVEVPPLAPLARNSVIVTPASIALTAIRDALEAAAPRNLAGKRDNVLPQVLSNAEISWTVARGPLAVAGRPEALTASPAKIARAHA